MGSRAAAWLIDILIQGAVLLCGYIALLAALGDFSGFADLGKIDTGRGMAIAFFLILIFLLRWGYYVLFESLMTGASPGKRAMGLQVVRADGEPLDFAAIAVRNLVRCVDDFPFPVIPVPVLAGLVAVSNQRRQRLGDFAASTIVVKARRGALLPPEQAKLSERSALIAVPGMERRLSEAELGVLRKYLNERLLLPQALSARLSARLRAQALAKTGFEGQGLDDIAYIEAVYRAHALSDEDIRKEGATR